MRYNNLDKLFKEKLQSHESEPPVYIWEKIEAQLTLKRQRKVLLTWWSRSLSAAAVVALCFAIWQFLPSKNTSSQEGKYTYLTNFYDLTDWEPIFSNDSSDTKIAPSSPIRNHQVKRKAERYNRDLYFPAIKTLPQELLVASNNVRIINSSHQNLIPLTNEEAVKNQEAYKGILNGEDIIPKTKKEKVHLTVSGHFIPAFSSGNYSSSVKNTRGYNYSSDQMNGIVNAGGGIKFSITTSKRLSFQTGVLYSRMGQRTADYNNSPSIAAFSTDTQSPRMTTPLGNIKTKKKAVAFRTAEAIVLNSMSDDNAEESLEQIFGAIEIPLYARYLLNANNKIAFTLIGGISGGFIVNNKVYLETNEDKELLGSTENIRKFNLSTDFSVGIEYPVTNKIKIMIEPGFRYYLQSLSTNELIDFKPYSFTLSTGVGIKF